MKTNRFSFTNAICVVFVNFKTAKKINWNQNLKATFFLQAFTLTLAFSLFKLVFSYFIGGIAKSMKNAGYFNQTTDMTARVLDETCLK